MDMASACKWSYAHEGCAGQRIKASRQGPDQCVALIESPISGVMETSGVPHLRAATVLWAISTGCVRECVA